jgi:hypothetical protein
MRLSAIEIRAADALRFWQQGELAQSGGQLDEAYRLFTVAHDLVTDCPRLHLQAHRRLRTINRLRRNWGEYCTDSLLLMLAPLGMFELLALLFRSKVAGLEACRRNA